MPSVEVFGSKIMNFCWQKLCWIFVQYGITEHMGILLFSLSSFSLIGLLQNTYIHSDISVMQWKIQTQQKSIVCDYPLVMHILYLRRLERNRGVGIMPDEKASLPQGGTPVVSWCASLVALISALPHLHFLIACCTHKSDTASDQNWR